MLRPLITFLLFGSLSGAVGAQALDDVRQGAEADLRSALDAYARVQAEIRDEAVPLNRRLNELNAQLREKRREAERARRLRDNRSVDLGNLRNRVEKRSEQIEYIANLVGDFGVRFERDLDLSERARYDDTLERFKEAVGPVVEGEEEVERTRPGGQLVILETAAERFDRLLAGDVYEGEAIVQGMVQQGSFLALGPTTYFASTDGFAGLSLESPNAMLPRAAAIGGGAEDLIAGTIADGQGRLPIDPTNGSALALAAERDTVWEHIRKGGIWIWPILFFALLAAIAAIFKAIEIMSVKMPAAGSLHDILAALNDGRKAEALRLAEETPAPAREMLVDAVKHADESKELIEEVMYERMLEVQPKLERLLPFIAVTAATAPLMGLLGTVTGMINTFELITIFGTGDAKQLSSGISEALVTTEFGLIVAIPALILHALLSRRAQSILARMEQMAVAFVNGITRRG